MIVKVDNIGFEVYREYRDCFKTSNKVDYRMVICESCMKCENCILDDDKKHKAIEAVKESE